MVCRTYPVNELGAYKYVVILSEYQGKILLSRHKERTTWECQGGHIEPGETPLEAAKRELYEESGALRYEITPLCDYRVDGDETGSMAFTAVISELGAMPESEIAEVQQFDCLPEHLTYPAIVPALLAKKAERDRKDTENPFEKNKQYPYQILFGTKNPAKLAVMERRLSSLGIRLTGLYELDAEIPEVEEDGKSLLENAKKKALAYYNAFHMPVFSCDSGLYFDEVPKELQPGTHVRRVGGRELNDEEMTAYYSGLARQYGGRLTARYRNAICLILDETHIYSAMEKEMESEPFFMVETPHEKRNPGFPLDCISVDIRSGKYYYDLGETCVDKFAVMDGVLEFFQKVFC